MIFKLARQFVLYDLLPQFTIQIVRDPIPYMQATMNCGEFLLNNQPKKCKTWNFDP